MSAEGDKLWASLEDAVATGFSGMRVEDAEDLISAAVTDAAQDPNFDTDAAQDYLHRALADAVGPQMLQMAQSMGDEMQDELWGITDAALARVTGASPEQVLAMRSDEDPSDKLYLYSQYIERS